MVYTFPAYVPGIAVAVSVLAALLGAYRLLKRKPGQSLKMTLFLFGVSIIAGPILAPTLAMDRVVLDDVKLEQSTGLWFSQTMKRVYLFDVESIQIDLVRKPKDLFKREVWKITEKNGRTWEIDPGDLWENNSEDIAERLRKRGIEVRR